MLEVEANEILYVLYSSTDTHLKNKCTQMYGTEKVAWKEKETRSKQCFCMTIEVVKADTCYEVWELRNHY